MKIFRKKEISVVLIGFSLVGFLFLGFGCGSSSDGEFVPRIDKEPLNLNFSVSNPSQCDLMQVEVRENGQAYLVTFEDIFVNGTYDKVTDVFTVEELSTIVVDTGEALFGPLEIGVTQPIRLQDAEYPTEGEVEITLVGGEIITVTVNPSVPPSGNPGLDIKFDEDGDGAPEAQSGFTWEELEDIWGDPTIELYQLIGSFFVNMFELFFERVELANDLLAFIDGNKVDLEIAGGAGIAVDCDEFPPQSGSRGSRLYVWDDANQDMKPGSGDNFTVTYNTSDDGCWIDDPTDDIDTLYKGILNLKGHEEEDTPLLIGGDLLFDNFKEWQTEEGMVDPSFEATTNGGFYLVFFE